CIIVNKLLRVNLAVQLPAICRNFFQRGRGKAPLPARLILPFTVLIYTFLTYTNLTYTNLCIHFGYRLYARWTRFGYISTDSVGRDLRLFIKVNRFFVSVFLDVIVNLPVANNYYSAFKRYNKLFCNQNF